MRIVAIDPSLTGTGLCATTTSNPAATFTETITCGKRGHDRLDFVLREIGDWTRVAQLVVIEGPSYGNQGNGRQSGHHERAGLWWLITHHLWRNNIRYVVVTPSQRALYATGKGNASKDTVLQAATRRYADIQFDGNNEADALILAAMAADHYGAPLAIVPAIHRAALAKVDWPQIPSPASSKGVA